MFEALYIIHIMTYTAPMYGFRNPIPRIQTLTVYQFVLVSAVYNATSVYVLAREYTTHCCAGIPMILMVRQ